MATPITGLNNQNVLQDREDGGSTTSKSSNGADALLNLYADGGKREGMENAPKTIKTIGSVETDEARVQEIEAKFKSALDEAMSASNDNGLKVLDDPDGLVAKKLVALSPKAVESYSTLIREAQKQLGELGHDAPVLKDEENLKRFFNIASMNVGDDEDGVKLKDQARQVIRQIREYKGGKSVDPSIEKLLFANDATDFIDQLKNMVKSGGLKVFSRENDGSVGRKVVKLVKGFGDLQEHAASVLMAKVDELLTGSPDRELIDNLTKTEVDALFSLRHTIARDFNAISSNELSKKYDGIDHLTGAEKENAEASLARIADIQRGIGALYNARTRKEYQDAQASLAKIHVSNFSEKYKIAHGVARADDVLRQLKSVEKSDIPQTVVIPTSFLSDSPENKIAFIRDTYSNATKTLNFIEIEKPDRTKITSDQARTQALALVEANKAQNNDHTVQLSDNTVVKLSTLRAFVDATATSAEPDERDKTKWADDDSYTNLLNKIQDGIFGKEDKDYQARKKDAEDTLNSIKSNFNANIYEETQTASEILAELTDEQNQTLINKLEDTTASFGAWTMVLSNENEEKIAQIRSLVTDAKNDLLLADNDIKRREDDEYKILYRPLGKNAETVAFAVRNAVMDYLVSEEDNEFTQQARNLLTKETKDALKDEQVAYLQAMRNSSESLIKEGYSIYQKEESSELFNKLGMTSDLDINKFYTEDNGGLKSIIQTIDNLAGITGEGTKSQHYSGSYTFSSTERALLTRDDNLETDQATQIKSRAEKLVIITTKLQELARTTATHDELTAALKSDTTLSNMFSNLVTSKEKVEPILKRLESIGEQVKDEEKSLKETRKELEAWTASGNSEGIFGYSTGKSFLTGSIKYLQNIVSRMFSHASDSVKKQHTEELGKRIEGAVKDLDTTNPFEEAAASALNQFATVDKVATYQKARNLAREIAATSDSTDSV
ncbi:MAG: hypothetical protein HOA17_06170 [Candidatus Melainabacteria bacterium]|nr:hypothetical protein [Candidatus Melainabacteria bacterium]